MLQREHIEKLLELNGVSLDASDEEIKSVLISARWHKDDVETAVLVLRENSVTHKQHVDSLHKVFRTDERLRPETVSALLGINMHVDKNELARQKNAAKPQVRLPQMLSIVFFSMCLAVLFVSALMWRLDMGVFHQTLR